EARELLRGLEKDAARLRSLPPQSLGQDFSQQVLQIIADRKADSTRRSARMVVSSIAPWLGLASAAAVLLVLSFGSSIYCSAADRQRQAELLAVGTARPDRTLPDDRLLKSETAAPLPAEPDARERLDAPTPERLATASLPPAFPPSADRKPK